MRQRFLMAAVIWLLAFGVAPVCRGGTPSTLEETRIAGKAYVRLSDWAKSLDFSVRWTKRDEALELSNAAARISLQIHSPEAEINGVEVRLLLPLVQKGDLVWISSADTRTTFEPVLAPPRLRRGTLQTICLDPGHGGKDPGFQVGGSQEKKLALQLAQELQSQLRRAGWKVNLTRSRDSFVELPSRPEIARRRKSDLFVSLHFNSTGSSATSVKGAEVYCLTPPGVPSTNSGGEGGGAGWFTGNHNDFQNMFLAYQVQKGLARKLGTEDRGVHRARFWVLRDATMPAILIEAGFLSHPVEGRKINTAEYRKQVASAIVESLGAYKQAVERRS